MPEEDFTTRFGRAMRKTLIHIIVIAIAGGVIFGFVFRKPALAGESSHNFGILDMADAKVSARHTFHLTNKTGKPIDIQSMKPDCGCTTAKATSMHVDSGANVDIEVTLEISKHGVKKSLITLDLGDAGVQILKVQATGRMLPRLFSPVQTIQLIPDLRTGVVSPVIVPVYASIYGSTDSPPGLTTLVPKGINATFRGWHLRHQPKDSSVTPSEWEGRIDVTRGPDELALSAEIQIEFAGAAAPLKIPVIMAPSWTGGADQKPPATTRTENDPATIPVDR